MKNKRIEDLIILINFYNLLFLHIHIKNLISLVFSFIKTFHIIIFEIPEKRCDATYIILKNNFITLFATLARLIIVQVLKSCTPK